jgi:diguanylate cyclase (GGDEF)-like protein
MSLASTVLEQLADGLLVLCDGRVLMVNAAACRLTGADRAALVGGPVPEWLPDADGEIALRGAGGLRTLQCERTPITLADDTPATLVTLRDRAAQSAREAELTRLAHRDGLTGLLNRRAFDARLHEEAQRLAARGRSLGMVIVDLDHFKRVNDERGHPVGDQVLAEAARRIAGVARTADSVGRLGGEEFGWLLPDATEADLLAAVRRLRARFAAAPFAGDLPLTASIGFCDLATAGSAERLVARADEALYYAKACGRDMALSWAPDIAERLDAVTDPRVDGADAFARLSHTADEDGHGARVANLAVAIAAHLDWTPDRQARLHGAARLHDLGKVALPSELIGRPGPLSDDERAHVGQHARIGAALAARVLDAEQESWVRGHHDRWSDAREAEGEGESEGAALIAVADAWDAMTTDRVYRPALTRAAALAELERHAGGQFRPDAGALVRHALSWMAEAAA